MRRSPGGPDIALSDTKLGSVILFTFILCVFLPGSFNLGPLIMTPSKMILFMAFPILFLQWIFGRAGPITVVDILFMFFCLWAGAAVLINNGLGRIFYVGSLFLEYFGAYLMGRILIRSAHNYYNLFKYFIYTLLIMLPFVLVEFLARRPLLAEIVGKVLSTDARVNPKVRLGLTRVKAGFPHPILWGLVCSIGVANAYFVFRKKAYNHIYASGFVFFMMFTALSSGPLFSAILQGFMIAWEGIFRLIRFRWILFSIIFTLSVLTLHVVLPGGLFLYIVNNFIYSPYAGLHRLEIFEFGLAEVLRNPVFGIGLQPWGAPFWRGQTFDNYWLSVPLRFGIPALVLLLLTIGLNAVLIMAQRGLTEEEARFRQGYIIALCGLVIVLGTVNLWANAQIFVMMYLGAGVWFYTRPRIRDRYRRRMPQGTEARAVRPRGQEPAYSRTLPESHVRRGQFDIGGRDLKLRRLRH